MQRFVLTCSSISHTSSGGEMYVCGYSARRGRDTLRGAGHARSFAPACRSCVGRPWLSGVSNCAHIGC